MHRPLATTVLASALLAATPLVAQGVLTVEELAQKVKQLRKRLSLRALKAPTEADKQALAKAEQELRDFVAWIEGQTGFTAKHYATASEPFAMWYPEEARRIAEAGAKALPDSREAHVQLGDIWAATSFSFPVGATRLEMQRSAAAAYRKALACGPDTWHAHGGLAQVLADLGHGDEAATELRLAMQETDGGAFFAPWQGPALLLQVGKPTAALALMRGPEFLTQTEPAWATKVDRLVITLRAHALANDVEATRAAIEQLRAAESSSRTVVESADALAYLGQKAAARQLLAARAVTSKSAGEVGWQADLYAKQAAAMEVLWNADDFSPSGPLRGELTRALGHHFLVDDGGKQVDVADSPMLMCKLLVDAAKDSEVPSAMGNHVLFVLSARAATTHQAKGAERDAIAGLAAKHEAIPGAEDVPARLLALPGLVGIPAAVGALTGLRALERLQLAASSASADSAKAPAGK